MARVAKVAPVAPTKVFEAAEQPIGKIEATMKTTGEAEIVSEIEVVQPERFTDAQAEALAFNEEMVTVCVQTTDDKFAPQWVEVANDGRKQLFWRGVNTTCARKFVEVLARAKPVGYKNVEYIDAEGNRSVKWPGRASLAFNFHVVRDDNPKGAAWLANLINQPV